MLKRILRKAKILLVLPDYIRSKNTVVSKKSQIFWGQAFANKVCDSAKLQNLSTGTALYLRFSPEFKNFIIDRYWDPYCFNMTNREIRIWLWEHIVFDGFGQVIGIHNKGKELYHKESWEQEVRLFCKIWM